MSLIDEVKKMSYPNNQSGTPTRRPAKTAFVSSRSQIPSRQAIALISDHGDPTADIGKEEAGGQNVYVRRVGEALARLGWQVDMFTRKVNSDDPAIVHHSPHCRTIRLVAGPEKFVPRDHLFEYMPLFLEAFQKFQSKECLNYPLIHTNYWMSAWVGLQLKQQSNIQLVHTYHSLGAVKYRTVLKTPPIADTRLSVEQAILQNANCVVATSPQERQALRSLVSNQGTVEVIPCGTDLETFRTLPKNDARRILGFDPAENIVLYVGRFDPRKGIETLVRAFAQLNQEEPGTNGRTLHPMRLVIVGGSDPNRPDGEERQRISQLVSDLGIAHQTDFVGQVGHDRLPLYYTSADVCVVPSHYEPFGLVAIEAMACGTPVVASDVDGLKFTVVPEETGLLVPPRNVEGFASAIRRILQDDLWARKLRRQAPVRVQENFSWTSVAAQLSHLYRRLLAQSLMHDFMPEVEAGGQAIAPLDLTKVS